MIDWFAIIRGRRLLCTHCNEPWTLHEIPEQRAEAAFYVCPDCRDADELDRAAEAEAQDRRDSLFQVPALPFNQRRGA